ncbi:MAG TPA: SDR family oxidoreductase [Acidimicrobiales bacterium]|nr:SDR family oxidoreductase [Acidimicrobiales bacterium]
MSIVITGATGNLGGLTVDALVRRGVEPSEVVAAGRKPDRLAEHAVGGVRTARFDIDDPVTLAAALEGAQKVLLVSLPGNPRRVEQHRSAIDAAKAAGVGLLVYTSFVHADTNRDHADHHATEKLLRESGLPHVVLRNGVYLSFFTRQIPGWREQGTIVGAAGDGRISAASPADLAEAAATVLTTTGHEGSVYELGGDDPFTMSELAVELSRQTGENIPYVQLPVDELRAHLVGAGHAEVAAGRRADVDRAIAAGEFLVDSGDLRRLVGRPLVTLSAAIAQALG